MRHILLLMAVMLISPAWAAEGDAKKPELPPPPTDSLDGGAVPEPEIKIIERPQEKIEEYRIGGVLYTVKVTPKVGPAYYLVDTDGDGNLETRRSDLDPRIAIPGWVIFRWK
ncbi:MAG: DUF2782 domain-containing protein [Gammaproteobacteria bacterium]|nr:DUF2782 domain-containing protein [Gammaproteobacteria bacterium]